MQFGHRRNIAFLRRTRTIECQRFAMAGGDHGLDRQRVEDRPGQDGQARPLVDPGGCCRGWCCHRLDPSAAAARPGQRGQLRCRRPPASPAVQLVDAGLLGYLILIGLFYYFVLPEAMRL